MRHRLSLLVRLIVATAITLAVVAVSLGRHKLRPLEVRRMAAPRYQPFNDALFQHTDSRLRVLDLEAGTLDSVRLADGGRLSDAACSPWRDSRGRTHVVGAWKSAVASGPRVVGMARYTIPTGEVLDQLELANGNPSGCPCWFPDASLRVLFASHDGRLYHVSFESPRSGRVSGAGEALSPEPVTWPNGLPVPSSSTLSEPTWPTDPRLGGRLIATVTFLDRDIAARKQPRSQLWWLRLKSDGSAIVEGDRLIRSCPPPRGRDPVREERIATVSAIGDGRMALAYMVRRGARPELELQLAPLTIDPATGIPGVDEADAVTIARDRAYAPPAFSRDGRWIYSLTPWPPRPETLERASVVNALDNRRRRRRLDGMTRSADPGD